MTEKINTAIIGAGIAGRLLLKELKNPRYNKYKVVGFIDDNESLIGTTVQNVKVLDSTSHLVQIIEDYSVGLFIIAIPSASGVTIQKIVEKIQKTNIDFMIVPPIFQNLVINQISYPRKVDINDLLRRSIENVLTEESMKQLEDSIILITGVAGSIGAEICIQIASCSPKTIIGIDNAETPLFNITNKIKDRFPKINFIPILGNIQDSEKLTRIFKTYSPQIIFHCAAYKHVGLMESFPYECVSNNIVGSIEVIEQAKKSKAQRFVFVSTDKAVNPTCIMGASKRIVEKYILSLGKNSTKFMTVRFGNVLESNGSAITIFKEQIERGGPVTITDLEMERYFMTIIEAAQLVIQASILGEGGELFVLDMGMPYKIINIIHSMVDLFGFESGTIPIKVIGKRPGEKIKEELFYKNEHPSASAHERILVCKTNISEKSSIYKSKIDDFIINYYNMDLKQIKEEIFDLAS